MFQPGGKIPQVFALSFVIWLLLHPPPRSSSLHLPIPPIHSLCGKRQLPFFLLNKRNAIREMCEMFCQHNHVTCHLIRDNKMEQNARVQAVTFEGGSREVEAGGFWAKNRELILLHNGNQAAWIGRKEGCNEVKCHPSCQAAEEAQKHTHTYACTHTLGPASCWQCSHAPHPSLPFVPLQQWLTEFGDSERVCSSTMHSLLQNIMESAHESNSLFFFRCFLFSAPNFPPPPANSLLAFLSLSPPVLFLPFYHQSAYFPPQAR